MNTKLLTLAMSGLVAASLSACASDGYAYRDSYYDGYTQTQYRNDGYRNTYAYDDRYSRRARCGNCGTVERIDIERYGDRRASGGGAVVGALVGAALGNQIGSGDGRKAATVAGAVAGGVAGNRIEKNRNSRDTYEIVVRMDNGRTIVLDQRDLNGVREGSRVVVTGGVARLL